MTPLHLAFFIALFILHRDDNHGFKNRIGPVGSIGSTRDRCSVRFGSLKKPKKKRKKKVMKNQKPSIQPAKPGIKPVQPIRPLFYTKNLYLKNNTYLFFFFLITLGVWASVPKIRTPRLIPGGHATPY